MIKRIFLIWVFFFSCLVIMPSCKLFKKGSKAETAQQKADKKKIQERKIREKQQAENVKSIYGRQTKETRKRMKANRAKSNRINKGLPEKQKRTFRFRLFKKPKWWR
jgi:hypothetical protein